jgi:hypothetical protein
MTVEQRISTAQWMLERQLYWASQAEVKVGAVVTTDIAMLAGLFAAYAHDKSTVTPWGMVFSAFFVVPIFLAVLFAAIALIPRLSPAPHKSGLFFGEISEQGAHDFVEATRKKTPDEILDDWLYQVHRNAQIADLKHKWVKRAVMLSFVGSLAWALAVYCLIKF